MKQSSEIVHQNKSFEEITFQEQTVIERSFIGCKFKKCNFYGLTFEDCLFENCLFENCDLSLIKVPGSSFQNVQVRNSKAIGILWLDASNPISICFYDSAISFSSFYGKNLKKVIVKNCQAEDVDFSECNLIESNFMGTDLKKSTFSNCDLKGANFIDAMNYSIDLRYNKASKTKFSLPHAIGLLSSFDIIIE